MSKIESLRRILLDQSLIKTTNSSLKLSETCVPATKLILEISNSKCCFSPRGFPRLKIMFILKKELTHLKQNQQAFEYHLWKESEQIELRYQHHGRVFVSPQSNRRSLHNFRPRREAVHFCDSLHE